MADAALDYEAEGGAAMRRGGASPSGGGGGGGGAKLTWIESSFVSSRQAKV